VHNFNVSPRAPKIIGSSLVSPLVELGVGDFMVGQTTLKVALSKVGKHEKTCSDNQHVFISFVFDIFGVIAPEVVDPLRSSKGHAQGLAAQLVARLSLIHV